MTIEGEQIFSAARSELPMLYVLLGLVAIELPIVHLLVRLWSATVAYALFALSLLAIVQIVAIIIRVRRGAVRLTNKGVTILPPTGREIALPWRDIADIKPLGYGPAPKGKEVLSAALLAHPNIAIASHRAFAVKVLGRSIATRTVTLRIDNPEAFVAAAASLLTASANTGGPIE